MSKFFYFLSLTFLILSCGKDVKNFTPSTKLKTILKNEKVNKIYYDLRTQTSLESRLDTVKSFKKFATETTVEELISLTECEQPVMRCLAFKALVEKDYPKIREILLRHKHDDKSVNEYSRCVEFHIPVKSYMLSQLEPFSKTKYKFSRKEYDEIRKDFSNK